jgi:hypothetical protein
VLAIFMIGAGTMHFVNPGFYLKIMPPYLETQIVWDDKPGGDVRVLASIDDGGWRAFVPLCDSLIMTPNDEIEESS